MMGKYVTKLSWATLLVAGVCGSAVLAVTIANVDIAWVGVSFAYILTVLAVN